MPHPTLPAGTHYALTVSIPENFGGMTASMLQRSRAFVRYTGTDVTILTYDHDTDYDATRDQLRASGSLIDGMQVVNLWEQLRTWDDDRLGQMHRTFEHPPPEGFEPLGERGVAVSSLKRELRDADGREVQIDYFRPDGTLLMSDQRPSTEIADRRVVLCDRSGRPLGAWTRMYPLYAFWLDTLPRDPVAWMIVDSKSSANMMLEYDRPDVARLHVVRGSHLKRGEGPMREMVASRQPVMENLDAWDAVMFLTGSQKADVEARFGERSNLYVIPNSRNVPGKLGNLKRPRGRGVMIASLESRKRIAHAIRAMARVQRRVPRRRPTLDVWGDGPLDAELRELIDDLGAPVELKGHAPNAADAFGEASFSVLTSSAEAFGNVIIESMGRGCIPISYDMPYGPSDIITDGADGFLVPNSDVDALAEQIYRVVRMPQRQLGRMRKAAYERALDFSDEHAVEQWAEVLATIAGRRGF